MTSATAIEESVREQFPLLLGKKEMVTKTEFQEAFNAVAEQGMKWAEPALQSETHKHQWTLVGASVALFVIVLFNVGKIKVGEATIDVDRQVLLWYSAFLMALLLTYLIRAGLDLKRAALAREKDAEKLSVLSDMIEVAWLRRNIEHYFWLELFHQIGARYGVYHRARSPRDSEPFEHIDMRILKLDLAALQKDDVLAPEIAAHEDFVSRLIQAMDVDVERFSDKLLEYEDTISTSAHSKLHSDHDRFTKVGELFERYLQPWFDARTKLTDEQAEKILEKGATREERMLEAQLSLLTRAKRIQGAYAMTEIALPSLLAAGAVVYAVSTVM